MNEHKEIINKAIKSIFVMMLVPLLNLIKVGLCLLVYHQFGIFWAAGLGFFFLLNTLTSIDKSLFDLQDTLKEMNAIWTHTSNIRKRI